MADITAPCGRVDARRSRSFRRPMKQVNSRTGLTSLRDKSPTRHFVGLLSQPRFALSSFTWAGCFPSSGRTAPKPTSRDGEWCRKKPSQPVAAPVLLPSCPSQIRGENTRWVTAGYFKEASSRSVFSLCDLVGAGIYFSPVALMVHSRDLCPGMIRH